MTTDKETLEQLSRIRLVVAEENRSTYDCYYAVKSALTIIDSLTTQLADRAAQIVRQGELLEATAMRFGHIREAWAGAEVGKPVHAQEAYALRLCKEMYQEAVDALAALTQEVAAQQDTSFTQTLEKSREAIRAWPDWLKESSNVTIPPQQDTGSGGEQA